MRRFVFQFLAILVFLAGLAVTETLVLRADDQAKELGRARFEHASERLISEVARRVNLPLYGLKGARAMMLSREDTRTRFGAELDEAHTRRRVMAAYAANRNLELEFPGVRGMGFIERVERADVATFEESLRARGDWSFVVRAQAQLASDLYVISAIEPRARNREAWGFDVGSESHRRQAVERALVTGEALTAPVPLVQDRAAGAGMLLLVPVFAPGAPLDTVAQRKAALRGFVYAPFVARELFAGVERAADRALDLDVYDVTDGVERLVFDSDDHVTRGTSIRDARFASHRTFQFAGRTLRVDAYSMPSFEAEVASPANGRGLGALAALACAAVVWVLGSSRQRALTLAATMTAELRAATERAESMNRANESLFRTLDSNFIVSMTDERGTIISANQAMLDVTGFAREELVGANHRIVNSGAHARRFWADMWATVSAGRAWRGEIRNRRKDGTHYWVDTVVALVPATHEQARRYISIRTDVTARKAAELELQHQTELAQTYARRAEDANQAKSSFLANMSHEIRTPMNGVLGMTELLLGMALTAEQEDVARTVYRSADALLVILNDVLDFSKIEAGKLDFESLPFDVHQVLYDTAELFKARALEKNVEVLVSVAPDVPREVTGDPTRVRQVVLNLVGNALKFIATGHVLLDLRRSGGQLVLAVEDTGPGIPEDRQRILFQPFTQADVSTSRKHGGTGLGLAISRRLAHGMGGELTMRSALDVGTCFTLTLPFEGTKPTLLGHRLRDVKVLVAESHPVQRSILSAQLESEGAVVEAVSSAEAAPPPSRATT